MLIDNANAREVLDPSSRLILEEAARRGIAVEILTPRAEYFRLRLGDKVVTCRESLSDRTSAVALSRCDDKRLTRDLLHAAGLSTPAQIEAGSAARNAAFLREHGAVVVKPACGEQGRGVSVDLRTPEELARAVARARTVCDVVLIEQFIHGDDLRLVVIGGEVAAAAVRRPPRILGDGVRTVEALIREQSARREAETAGESKIPLDAETARCVAEEGFRMDEVLPLDHRITVRRAANVHSGGTIEDVTPELHPALAEVGRRAAAALEIPVVGLDLIVRSPRESAYWIVEANERPGLANHEPQPTAQRFVDFLFPETR